MSDKKTIRIARLFGNLKQAEKFQDKLYDKYNGVSLVRSPLFAEEGIYEWEVSN